MFIALWILAGLLAVAMLGAGLMKLTTPLAALVAKGQAWAADFPPGAVKAIGAAEVLGAIGLVVPAVTHIAPILVPIAAAALAVLLAGAVVVHIRRGDGAAAALPAAALAIIAVVVAWGRFGPYAF